MPTGRKESCGGLTGKTMNIPNISIKQLLEAGVHLGHKTLRWNPKMKKFILAKKIQSYYWPYSNSHFNKKCYEEVHKCVASGGKILIVSTKKQAAETVLKIAIDTNQYFINYRWLGGMLTNWKTIQNSIKRLKKLDIELSKEDTGFTKKEVLKLTNERDKLKRSLGGISDMNKIPNMLFIIDTNVESLAVKEAIKLKIPIVAVLDSNSDPTGIDYPIPGNDDARRSINLYCELLKDTILDAKKNIAKTNVNGKDDKIVSQLEKKDKTKEKTKKTSKKKR